MKDKCPRWSALSTSSRTVPHRFGRCNHQLCNM